jgi:hypothetical protein
MGTADMPYPDGFSPTLFARRYGDDATDAAADRADAAVARDVDRAARLKAKLTVLLTEIGGTEFETTFPAPGYGMDDLLGMLTDIRDGIDLPAYRVRATAVATDMAMGGDL